MSEKNEVKPLGRFELSLDTMLKRGIKALPTDVNSDRLKLNALMYIASDSNLRKIAIENPGLIAQIVYNFIALGLDMMNRECYIIPFGSVPTVIRDYKGEEKLAKKYSIKPIRNIVSNVVCENDEHGVNDEGNLYHKYKPFDSDEKRGKKIGAYCKVFYQDGSEEFETVNLDEIKRVKAVSKTAAREDSVWNKWEEAMYRKTAVKKMMKRVPLDFGSFEAAKRAYETTDNDVSFERKNTDEVIAQDEPLEIIDVEVTERNDSQL